MILSKRFINGYDLTNMVSAGAAVLKSQVETVNSLNVFPVPDGDTGTNMNMTISAGVEHLQKKAEQSIGQCAEILSKGLLMGARGNSGVILSQLFRGFAKAVQDQEEINTTQFAAALQQGVDTAYQAVVKPVEGTILTVSREAAKHAVSIARRTNDLEQLMREVYQKAQEALNKTPEQLPILKQVGVVDSGGQGLVFIYEGFVKALSGEAVSGAMERSNAAVLAEDQTRPEAPIQRALIAEYDKAQAKLATEDIEFPYDMEFFIQLTERTRSIFVEEKFRNQLALNGDSILIIQDDDVVKVHVHSRAPGDVLNQAMQYGELSRFHIENMKETHRGLLDDEPDNGGLDHKAQAIAADSEADISDEPEERVEKPAAGEQSELKRYGFVAVAAGEGVTDIFYSLGVDSVLSGGQTMNPSTEDIVQAVSSVAAETVFVFPNNSNIILAAEQARELSDKQVIVIPSKTIPQGMSALLAFQESLPSQDNETTMKETLQHVKSGQITSSIRDTTMDDVSIKKGDFIGILDNRIVSSTAELVETARSLLDAMLTDDEEIVTILAGEDADSAVTEHLIAHIEEQYPNIEVEAHQGDQPVYHYIISAE